MEPTASVIVPTYADWGALQHCLDCLAAQSVPADAFEIIVANNNASPGVPEDLRLPLNGRIIHVPKPGSYAARNAGVREARGSVIFFTDSDCRPDSRWIEAGLAAMEALGPEARLAGAVEVFPSGPAWTGVELYDRVNYLRQDLLVKEGWCATANLVTRRATFDLLGGFSEDRFSSGDREWTSLGTSRGLELGYCPAAVVRHPARGTFAELAKKRRRLTGGYHQGEVTGRFRRLPLTQYMAFLSPRDLRRTMSFPGLTETQRFQVLWISFRLGMVGFAEILRLRYFRGKPRRS